MWRRRRFFHTLVLGLLSLTVLFMYVHVDGKLSSLIIWLLLVLVSRWNADGLKHCLFPNKPQFRCFMTRCGCWGRAVISGSVFCPHKYMIDNMLYLWFIELVSSHNNSWVIVKSEHGLKKDENMHFLPTLLHQQSECAFFLLLNPEIWNYFLYVKLKSLEMGQNKLFQQQL